VTGTDYPDRWSSTENVAWKVAVPGRGNSSPIVWGDRVILTTAYDDGRRLTVLALRRSDGGKLWETEHCCGAAGIYNLVEPATSDAVLAPKLRHIASTGADWVVTGNPGCLMQIGAGLRRARARARVVHPVDLLDVSYARSAAND